MAHHLRKLLRLFGGHNGIERRRYERAEVDLEVVVRHEGRDIKARIFDVSISGALLSPEKSLMVGATIEIALPRIPTPVAATVVRVSGGMAGIQFDDPGDGVMVAGWSRGTTQQEKHEEPG